MTRDKPKPGPHGHPDADADAHALDTADTDTADTDTLTVAVLRGYLRRWKWEVGQFFDGVGPDSTDDELLEIADKHPMFRITTKP